MMVSCKQTYKFICDNLDQNIDSPACIQIKKHLTECPNCRANLDSLKMTVLLYKNQQNPKLKKSISKQILKLVKFEGKGANCGKKRRIR